MPHTLTWGASVRETSWVDEQEKVRRRRAGRPGRSGASTNDAHLRGALGGWGGCPTRGPRSRRRFAATTPSASDGDNPMCRVRDAARAADARARAKKRSRTIDARALPWWKQSLRSSRGRQAGSSTFSLTPCRVRNVETTPSCGLGSKSSTRLATGDGLAPVSAPAISSALGGGSASSKTASARPTSCSEIPRASCSASRCRKSARSNHRPFRARLPLSCGLVLPSLALGGALSRRYLTPDPRRAASS